MADDLTTQSATPATIPASSVIATDEAAGAHVQIVKLAQSGDGVRTPISADADGMLVNLGSNNDVTVTGTVTADTELPAAAALADAASNPTTPISGAALLAWNTATWDRVRSAGDNADGVSTATLGRLTVNAKSQVFNGSNWDRLRGNTSGLYVHGTVAHDAADVGNPVKVGYKAVAHGTTPTAVAAGDRVDSIANRSGLPFVIAGHPNVVTIRANYTTAQTDAAIVSVSAGTKIVVTACSIGVDNACSVDVAVRIGFGAASTPTTTGVFASHPGFAAGSGIVLGSAAGILGIGADGEDIRITSEVPTGGSIDVVISYYTVSS